jgi:hypothetical protein
MPLAKGPPTIRTQSRRNVYVRAEDAEVWKRAENLAGASLSQLLADQLRRYVAEQDARRAGIERIVVEAVVKGEAPPGPWDKGDVRKVAFYGRWLVGEPVRRKNPIPGINERAISDGDMHMYGVAITKGGKIAVLELDLAEGSGYGNPPYLTLYDSLKAADQGGAPHWVLDQAATALNTELVDELDV